MASLTRADLHDELQKFASDVLQNALTELRQRIVTDLRGLGVNDSAKDVVVPLPAFASIPQGGKPSRGIISNKDTRRVPRLGKGFRSHPKEWPDMNQPEGDKLQKDKVPAGSLAIRDRSMSQDSAKGRCEGRAEPSRPLNMAASFLNDDDEVCDHEEASSLLEPAQAENSLPLEEYSSDAQDKSGCPGWRSASCTVANFVRGTFFNYATCTVVIINSLLIGAQTDYLIRHLDEEAPPAIFDTLDVLFCGIFTVELCLRFIAFGWSFFFMQGWQWNVFDLVVVALQVISS